MTTFTAFTLDALRTELADIPPSAQIWVAFSGGLDSTVLLHALAELSVANVHAIHINHGWHRDREAWVNHCRNTSAALHIPFHTQSIDAQIPKGRSTEAHARKLRYAQFAHYLQSNDYLLTAHQQDDQAETLLLQLLRGTGVNGLASMPRLARFAKGLHLRPLLPFTRQQLQAYAIHKKLTWIDDTSNAELRFQRNFLRNKITPLLQQQWPNFARTLARTAINCAEASALLTTLADADLLKVRGKQPHTLCITALQPFDAARQRNILRRWLQQLHLPIPHYNHLTHIQRDVLASATDACPIVTWDHVQIRRYQQEIYALTVTAEQLLPPVTLWPTYAAPLIIESLGTLHGEQVVGHGIRLAALHNKPLEVRFRQGGERCQPCGRQGSHPLKKLFQEWHIPPWERDRIPLIFCEGQLIAVVGYCVHAPFAARAGEAGWQIKLDVGV